VAAVSFDVPEAFGIDGGLKPQLAPLGSPEQESVTVPLNPNVGVTFTVEVAEFPATTVAGDNAVAESSKPGVVVFNAIAT